MEDGSPSRYIGREVSKYFQGYSKPFRGSVDSHRRVGKDFVYRVSYEDGDDEDLRGEELQEILVGNKDVALPPNAPEGEVTAGQEAMAVEQDRVQDLGQENTAAKSTERAGPGREGQLESAAGNEQGQKSHSTHAAEHEAEVPAESSEKASIGGLKDEPTASAPEEPRANEPAEQEPAELFKAGKSDGSQAAGSADKPATVRGRKRKGRPVGFRPSLHSKAALAAIAAAGMDIAGPSADQARHLHSPEVSEGKAAAQQQDSSKRGGNAALSSRVSPASETRNGRPTSIAEPAAEGSAKSPATDAAAAAATPPTFATPPVTVGTAEQIPSYRGKKGRPVGWRKHLHSKEALAARAAAEGGLPPSAAPYRPPSRRQKLDDRGNPVQRRRPGPKPKLDEFGNRVNKPARPRVDAYGNRLPKLKPGPKSKASGTDNEDPGGISEDTHDVKPVIKRRAAAQTAELPAKRLNRGALGRATSTEGTSVQVVANDPPWPAGSRSLHHPEEFLNGRERAGSRGRGRMVAMESESETVSSLGMPGRGRGRSRSIIAAVRGRGRAGGHSFTQALQHDLVRHLEKPGRGFGGRPGVRRPGRFQPVPMEQHYKESIIELSNQEGVASMHDWDVEPKEEPGLLEELPPAGLQPEGAQGPRGVPASAAVESRMPSKKVLGLGGGLPSPTGRKVSPRLGRASKPQILGLGGGLPRRQGASGHGASASRASQPVEPADSQALAAARILAEVSQPPAPQAIERKGLLKSPRELQHQCVVFNDVAYTSACSADDTASEEGSTYLGQLEQVLLKLDDVLAQVGSSKQHILSAHICLRSIADGAGVLNKLWQLWISQEHLPARTVVEGQMAHPSVLVQISLVAAIEHQSM